MKIDQVRGIWFSPTGTSRQVVQSIAEGFNGTSVEETDLTYPDFTSCGNLGPEELAIIGVPVYAGRVPALALERMEDIKGTKTPAVIVAVYGNREFEDALVELRDIVEEKGFIVVAAAAFIGEHSFSTDALPIAAGRPDAEDLEKARAFGRAVKQAVSGTVEFEGSEINIPGNIPYKDGVGNFSFTPVVDHEACSLCGTCADECPTGSITLGDEVSIAVQSCILCANCIKVCPEDAVSLDSTPMRERMVLLNTNCAARKEPQIFM